MNPPLNDQVARRDALAFGVICLVIFYLSVLSVSRSLHTDYANYDDWYYSISFAKLDSCLFFEVGYCAIAVPFKLAGLSFQSFVSFTSGLIYFLLVHSAYRIFLVRSNNINTSLSLSLFVLVLISLTALRPEMLSHLIRQYICASLLCIALTSKTRGFSIAISAVLFHYTAVIFLPAWILFNGKSQKFHPLFVFSSFIVAVIGATILGKGLYSLGTSLALGADGWSGVPPLAARVLQKWVLYGGSGATGLENALRALLVFSSVVALIFLPWSRERRRLLCCLGVAAVAMFATFPSSAIIFDRFWHYEKFFLFVFFLQSLSRLADAAGPGGDSLPGFWLRAWKRVRAA